MSGPLRVISSMATARLLRELVDQYQQNTGQTVELISIGGVDAAQRVADGEAFDLVVLEQNAIDKLAAAGQARSASVAPLAGSRVAIAVQAGQPLPDISSASALRAAVLAARTIGYSTGPSGRALLQLLAQWGLTPEDSNRLIQAPPGMPVGKLVAQGKVEIGFQQRSELIHLSGISIVGEMPDELAIVTVFAGAICTASTQANNADQLLRFLTAPAVAAVVRAQGLLPPTP